MSLAMQLTGEADVQRSSGIHEDDWCERSVTLEVTARNDVSVCEISVWLKPESGLESAFEVGLAGGTLPFATAVAHDVPTVVHAACSIRAGNTATLQIQCDNRVTHKGEDLRDLSFKILALRFL